MLGELMPFANKAAPDKIFPTKYSKNEKKYNF